MVRSPSRANTCFARAFRLRGQNRVPLPPARITGANFSSVLLPSMGISLHLSEKTAPSSSAVQTQDQQLTQRREVVPHSFDTFIYNVVRYSIRKSNMLRSPKRLTRNNHNMSLTQEL